jgi:hypothetical protein
VSTVLRLAGAVNAAAWLGAAIFFTFVAGPAFFSDEMLTALNKQRYFAGLAAQVVIKRYFLFHYACGAVAVAHLLSEWIYLGRPIDRIRASLLVGIIALTLFGGVWLQPALRDLHHTIYLGATATQREQARKTFRAWHGASQAANLLAAVGLLVYFWRVASPAEASRFSSFTKFRS